MGSCRLLCLSVLCQLVVCPKGQTPSAALAAAGGSSTSHGAGSSSRSTAMLGAVAATATAAWALVSRSKQGGGVPEHVQVPRSARPKKTIVLREPPSAHPNNTIPQSLSGREHSAQTSATHESEAMSESEGDQDAECSACEEEVEGDGTISGASSSSAGKLWSAVQFPEGTDGVKCWDVANLMAAQQWECPCHDRTNCISADRVSVLELYEYRKAFRTAHAGNTRDACRCPPLAPLPPHCHATATPLPPHCHPTATRLLCVLAGGTWSSITMRARARLPEASALAGLRIAVPRPLALPWECPLPRGRAAVRTCATAVQ